MALFLTSFGGFVSSHTTGRGKNICAARCGNMTKRNWGWYAGENSKHADHKYIDIGCVTGWFRRHGREWRNLIDDERRWSQDMIRDACVEEFIESASRLFPSWLNLRSRKTRWKKHFLAVHCCIHDMTLTDDSPILQSDASKNVLWGSHNDFGLYTNDVPYIFAFQWK